MRLRERRAALYSRFVVHNGFRLIWVMVVIWYEFGTYYWSLSSCKWPSLGSTNEKSTHVLLISDTQFIHGRNVGISQAWRRFLTDLNVRKNWHVTSRLNPHAVIFLGDMLASGRTLRSAKEYNQAAQQFKSVFTLPGVPMYYVPGNTDISLGMATKHSKDVKSFFTRSFGPLNQEFSIQNHTFIALDAPGLVDEDYQRAAQGRDYDNWNSPHEGTVAFVRSVYVEGEPVILLSHIPLSRPTTASCGPLREKGTIHRNVGQGYQSMLGKQTTQFLLETLRPSLIFSGDNRDYCEFTHSFVVSEDDEMKQKKVREVTVKSFSMSRHIRQPGSQLLSLVNPSPSDGASFSDSFCLLPDQDRIYSTIYPTLMVMTLLILFILNKTRTGRNRRNHMTPLPISSSQGSTLLLANGRTTPLQNLDADPWTPRTANSFLSPSSSTHASPRFSSGRKLRTSSCPTTPRGSPPRRYIAQPGESDEEEAMYPVYSSHRYPNHSQDHDLRSNGDWTSRREDSADDELTSVTHAHFSGTSAAGWKPVDTSKPSWSWTFVFRGRRRRMTLAIPAWEDLSALCQNRIGRAHRKGVAANTVIDMISTLWPAWLAWIIITWCHF
ncbi:hypothetical protein AX15_006828 [Amanita polypyramis BW_CC]|nr:hypothetical protein AX15_006828 [Amanita polypyramis BW_CC]